MDAMDLGWKRFELLAMDKPKAFGLQNTGFFIYTEQNFELFQKIWAKKSEFDLGIARLFIKTVQKT